MKLIILVFAFVLLTTPYLYSQNYHAIQGSSHAGSLGVSNNPASIVNASDAWDVTPLAVQFKSSTNAVTVLNYSLLSSPRNSQYRINSGDYGRYGYSNFNLHLLNARVAINRRHSVAFGMNVRGYLQVKTDKYNFIDSLSTLKEFLQVNESNKLLQGNFKSNSWVEIFGTYSQTIWDNEISRLNGGITLKGMRGGAAVFGGLEGIGFARTMQTNLPAYFLKNGSATYAYSSNLDQWQSNNSISQNLKDVVVRSEGSFSLDVGFEYLLKRQEVAVFNDDDNYYEYEWKIGVALLDMGSNQYKFSPQSRYISNAKENVSDRIIERKFEAPDIKSFNDSIAGLLNNVQALSGKFFVINPVRLVINVDRSLTKNFYVNGDLSANLSSLAGKERLYQSELNLLTVTPRWEKKKLGLYLPMQLNIQGQFWVGMAFKAGPLLFGVHNLSNVFAKNKIQNGGAYLGLTIHPGNLIRSFRDKRNNCPEYVQNTSRPLTQTGMF